MGTALTIDKLYETLTPTPLHNTHTGRCLFIHGQPYPSEGGSPVLPNFGGSLICMRTSFVVELPNLTNTSWEECLFLVGQPQSREELQRSPILGFSIYDYTLYRRTTSLDVVTHGGWLVFRWSAAPCIPRWRGPSLDANFAGSSLLMHT